MTRTDGIFHVRVYYNLHKNMLSVQRWFVGKGWRVSEHTNQIVLRNVKFKVSEKGRQRVLKERKKNVHAYIEGFIAHDPLIGLSIPTDVFYNPYKHNKFYQCKKRGMYDVEEAKLIIIDGKRIQKYL